MKFADGGVIAGPAAVVTMERVGQCIHGFCLYRFNSERPEHLVTSDEARRGDLRKLRCDCGGRLAAS